MTLWNQGSAWAGPVRASISGESETLYVWSMSLRMTKPTIWHVHPSKTQISLISLNVRPVSECFECWHYFVCFMAHEDYFTHSGPSQSYCGEKKQEIPEKKTPDQQQWNDKWFRALKISILKGAADTYIKEPSAMGLQLFNKDWSLSLMMSQTIHYYDLLKTEHIGEIICNITNRNLQLQKANVYNLIF